MTVIKHPILVGAAYATPWTGDELPAPDSYYPVGLVTKGEFAMTEEGIELPDTMSVAGGIADSFKRIKSVTVKMTLQEWKRENLVMALFGSDAVTPEQVMRERFLITRSQANVRLAYGMTRLQLFTEDFTPNSLIVGSVVDHNQILFKAVNGTTPKIALVQPDSANLATSVSVVGQSITVLLKYDGTAITSTVADVITAIQASVSASLLVTAEIVAGSNSTAIVAVASAQLLSGQTGQYFRNQFDYTIYGGMLSVTANSAIPLNTPLIADMSIPRTLRVSGASVVPAPISLMIEQYDAKTNMPMRLFMPKVQFSPAAKIEIFAEKATFAPLDLSGDVQKNTNVITHELWNAATAQFENVSYGNSPYFYYDAVC